MEQQFLVELLNKDCLNTLLNLLNFAEICRLRKVCKYLRGYLSPSYLYSRFEHFIFDPFLPAPKTDQDILNLLKIRNALILGKLQSPNTTRDQTSDWDIYAIQGDYIIFCDNMREFFRQKKSTGEITEHDFQELYSNQFYSPTSFQYCNYQNLVVDGEGKPYFTKIPKKSEIITRTMQEIIYFDPDQKRVMHQSISKSRQDLQWEDVHYPSLILSPKAFCLYRLENMRYHSSEFCITGDFDPFERKPTITLEFHFPNDPHSKKFIVETASYVFVRKCGKERFLFTQNSKSTTICKLCGPLDRNLELSRLLVLDIGTSADICDRCGVILIGNSKRMISVDLSTMKTNCWLLWNNYDIQKHKIRQDRVMVCDGNEKFKFFMLFDLS